METLLKVILYLLMVGMPIFIVISVICGIRGKKESVTLFMILYIADLLTFFVVYFGSMGFSLWS